MSDSITKLKDDLWNIYGENAPGNLNDDMTRHVIYRKMEHELNQNKVTRVIRKFSVTCDKDNNPPEVIANNDLVVTIILMEPNYQEHSLDMDAKSYAEWEAQRLTQTEG